MQRIDSTIPAIGTPRLLYISRAPSRPIFWIISVLPASTP